MNPQSFFPQPPDIYPVWVSWVKNVLKCILMHDKTLFNTNLRAIYDATSRSCKLLKHKPLSLAKLTGLNNPPKTSQHLNQTRVVPLSPSCGRPDRQGCRSGDN